jgi:hypothetical protein
MKVVKIAVAIMALSLSAHASAMPPQVPSSWYGLMQFAWSMVSQRPCNDQTDAASLCGQ